MTSIKSVSKTFILPGFNIFIMNLCVSKWQAKLDKQITPLILWIDQILAKNKVYSILEFEDMIWVN